MVFLTTAFLHHCIVSATDLQDSIAVQLFIKYHLIVMQHFTVVAFYQLRTLSQNFKMFLVNFGRSCRLIMCALHNTPGNAKKRRTKHCSYLRFLQTTYCSAKPLAGEVQQHCFCSSCCLAVGTLNQNCELTMIQKGFGEKKDKKKQQDVIQCFKTSPQ